ncbi:FAD-linked oxidase [Streptomyces hygroscopicus subsp. limoneus]|nr:FAD-linked oxidase [Streptomyces hygroscopicus subsp. limoneus]
MQLVDRLASRLDRGALAMPGSPEYEKTCALYSTTHLDRPQVVARCRTEKDVSAAVRTAAEEGVRISPRGGGHNASGRALCEGIVLDFSEFRSVTVDPERRLAKARPGATWSDYDTATQEYGLASPGGVISTTGVAGLTLGGGIGALRGLYGFACDNLKSADVVLADGSLRTVSATRDPDLFWALHGGSGNFGVVVGFEFNVHPVTRMVSGLLAFPLEEAAPVLTGYAQRADELPDEFMSEIMFISDPTPGSDRKLLVIIPRYAGSMAEAGPVLGLLRGLGTPVIDDIQEFTYKQSQCFLDAMTPWGNRHHMRSQTLTGINGEAVDALVRLIRNAPGHLSQIVLEEFRGEITRIAPDATPIGFRQARFNVMITAQWQDEADDEKNMQWTRDVHDVLAPWSAGGGYVNYMPRESTPDDLRHAYGDANFRRLQKVKAAYDPENLFRSNLNIPPAQ